MTKQLPHARKMLTDETGHGNGGDGGGDWGQEAPEAAPPGGRESQVLTFGSSLLLHDIHSGTLAKRKTPAFGAPYRLQTPPCTHPGPGDPCGAELLSSTKASGPWWGLDMPPITPGGARSLTRAGAGERRVVHPLTWLHSDGDSNLPSGPVGQTRWFGATSRFPHPCVLLLLLPLLLENPPNANVM